MPRVDRSLFCQILVVDGKSTDNTVQVARDMGFDVVVQDRPGVRGAYLDAWAHVKGDAVITFSPTGILWSNAWGPASRSSRKATTWSWSPATRTGPKARTTTW